MSDVGGAVGLLGRAAGALESVGQASTPGGRAEGIARAMLVCWPGASAVGCRLRGGQGEAWAALGADGQPHHEGVGVFGPPSIRSDMGTLGELAVRPATPSSDDQAALRLLGLAAAGLLRGQSPGNCARCLEMGEQAELAAPVMHEFNNLLNTLSLRLMLLENDLPPAHADPMARIRARIAEVAQLVARYQARRRAGVQRLAADLPGLLSAVARETGRPVEIMAGDPPPVLGDPTSLRTLVSFLLCFATAHSAAGPGPAASFSVEEGGWVRLRLETCAPAPENGVDYFKPRPPGPDGATGLELPASRSLVYRAAGRLNVAALGPGRVALLLDLPAAPSA